MSLKFPRGIFPPCVTPFNDAGVDRPRTRAHVARLIATGAHGICVAGSGGEFIAMTVDERRILTETVAEELGGRYPMIVTIAGYTTAEAVELGRHARECGATAVMAGIPIYMLPSNAAIYRHLAAIREAVDLPVMLYHVPATTGIELSLAEIEQLVSDGIIQAIKQSFADSIHTRDAKLALGDLAAVYCGQDMSALESLIMGADGWISATPNVLTARARRLWDSVQNDDALASLVEQWKALLPFIRFVFDPALKSGGAPHTVEIMKTAITMMGTPVGPPRPPLALLHGKDEARLRALLVDLGELPSS